MSSTRTRLAPVTEAPPTAGCCRACGTPLEHTFVDLGSSPPCESFLRADQLELPEVHYPLHVRVCADCKLVQLPEHVSPEEIFDEYAYFSSYSDSWLRHAAHYCDEATRRLGLGAESFVVEVASNDGYLLRNFVAAGVPCLGVEPSHNVAAAARQHGVESVQRFFGRDTAAELAGRGRLADLIAANNVLAHVPDLNDFVAGLARLLAPGGTVTLEFPHLMRLVEGNQFDTIYHEHYSYLSLLAARRVLAAHGLEVYDVEELATHGGSLRLWAQHAGPGPHSLEPSVAALEAAESDAGYEQLETYLGFAPRVERVKRDLLRFLVDAREAGETVVAYGAPGKGNTLLNYCGIRSDLIAFAVDRNPYKHGRFTPGTRIPIHAPERLDEARPEHVLILPWNLADEIAAQLAHVREWGGRLVVPIPRLEVL